MNNWEEHEEFTFPETIRGPVCLAPDLTVIAAANDREITVSYLQSESPDLVVQSESSITCVALSKNTMYLVCGTFEGHLQVWTLTSVSTVYKEAHDDCVNSIVIPGNNLFCVSGSKDHDIKVWTLPCLLMTHHLRGHSAPVTCISISSDNSLVVSGSEDKTVKLWDLDEGLLKAGNLPLKWTSPMAFHCYNANLEQTILTPMKSRLLYYLKHNIH